MKIEYLYCDECVSVTKHKDGECCYCNPDYNMSYTQELDFSDTLYDRRD